MILVIGYGSLLRGDDGIGQRAASILQQHYKEPEVTVLPCEQLTPEMMESISQADLVIFIDASISLMRGAIKYQDLEPSAPTAAFTHTLSASTLLEGAQSLYGRSPAGALFSVGAESFDLGEKFSPAVEAAMPGLLALIKERIGVQCMNLPSSRHS